MRKVFDISFPRRGLIILFLITVATAYVFPRWSDPNQNSRLDMVFAVVEDGSLQIDSYVENTVDYAKVGDHYYSDKAPGTAFVGIPIYAVLRQIIATPMISQFTMLLQNSASFQSTLRAEGTGVAEGKVQFAIAQVVLVFLLATLPTMFICYLLFRTEEMWVAESNPRLVSILGYALLTPVFAYAGALYGHQLSAAALFTVFFLLAKSQGRLSSSQYFLLGLLLGFSVLTEYPAFIIVCVLLIYAIVLAFREEVGKRVIYLLMGGAIFAFVLLLYNDLVFGGPFEFGYKYSELWTNQHNTGFMSLSLPSLEALWGITFSEFRGLFFLSPWLLLSLPGALIWWKEGISRLELYIVLAILALFLLFNASSGMWWGGYAVGPRYLLPALPFAVLPTVFYFDRCRRVYHRILAGLLFAWSLVSTWGVTLAEQAFPPDTIAKPFQDFAIPNWLDGNVARNVGHVFGIQGVWSLIPLLLILVICFAILRWDWICHLWLNSRKTAGS